MEVRVCELCACEVTVLHPTMGRGRFRRHLELCDVCYHTHLGNVLFNSNVPTSERDVLIALGQCTNLILEEIRKLKG